MGRVCIISFISCSDVDLCDWSNLWKQKKATKVGAIVGGQTSCKAPELEAFDKHLPPDVEVVSCHSLHGPKVNPAGQPLVRTSTIPFYKLGINDDRSSFNIERPMKVSAPSQTPSPPSARNMSSSRARNTTASPPTPKPSPTPRS